MKQTSINVFRCLFSAKFLICFISMTANIEARKFQYILFSKLLTKSENAMKISINFQPKHIKITHRNDRLSRTQLKKRFIEWLTDMLSHKMNMPSLSMLFVHILLSFMSVNGLHKLTTDVIELTQSHTQIK